MKAVIGEILPLALVVTISPINIIAAILLLFSERPVVNASSYLVGFVAGVAAVLSAFIVIADALDLSAGSETSRGAAALMLVLGFGLLAAALGKFAHRPRAGAEPSMPKWMDGMAGYSSGRSLLLGGVVGALNPKNVVVGLAAALAIGSAGLSTTAQVGVSVVYVIVAVLGVAAPIAMMIVLGDRAHGILDGWKTSLSHRQFDGDVRALLHLRGGADR